MKTDNKRIILATAPEAVMTKSYSAPLGLLYVASSLQKAGFQVRVIDAYAQKVNISDVVRQVRLERPLAFGVTGTTENRFNVAHLLNEAKNASPETLTIWGGPHATLTYASAVSMVPGVDVVVKGEGEVTTVNLLNNFSRGLSYSGVGGIAFRDDCGNIIENPLALPASDLDALALPARELINLKSYPTLLEGENKTPAVGVISSRGCPFECTFCANVALGKRFLRKRSPSAFADEVEHLYRKYGFIGFDIWDDTLTVDRDHVCGICEEFLLRGFPIRWYARARVDCVDEKLLVLMKKAGCVSLGYGIESGSPRMLNAIKKGTEIEQARRAVRISARLGFTVKCFFIVSLPGEQLEDIRQTVDFMAELRGYGSNVQCSYSFAKIYPGTEIERAALNQNLLPRDFSWNKYCEFSNSRLLEENPTIPLFENPYLSLKDIKSYILSSRYGGFSLITKGVKRLLSLRGYNDVKRVFSLTRDIITAKRKTKAKA